MGAVTELKSLGEARGQLFGVRLIAFSPDAKLVATGDVGLELALWREGKVTLRWDMSSDYRRQRLGSRIRAASFSEDGSRLYVAAGDVLWCLDTVTGAVRWEHQSRSLLGFLRNSCLSAAALPDNQVVATYDDGKFEVRQHDGRLTARWGHHDCPRFISPADDGRSVVGSDSYTVSVWDLAERRQTARFVPGERIVGFAASAGSPLVAVRTLEEYILWDRDRKVQLYRMPSDFGLPCVDVCPVDDLVAFAGIDGVGLWNSQERQVARADAKGMRVLSVKFSPDGATLAAGCMDGTVHLWDVGALLREQEAQPGE